MSFFYKDEAVHFINTGLKTIHLILEKGVVRKIKCKNYVLVLNCEDTLTEMSKNDTA